MRDTIAFAHMLNSDSALETVIDGYIRYYAAGESHTSRAKRLDIKHFIQFLVIYRCVSSVAKLTLRDWDHSTVERFVEERLAKGETPATVARRLATLKHVGRIVSEQAVGFVNPARAVKPPRQRINKPKHLDAREVQHLKHAAADRLTCKRNFGRLRNEMIVNLLLDTGLRADEVRLLKVSQLSEDLSWIQGVRTKSRNFRNVYISSGIRVDLGHYLTARRTELLRFFDKLPEGRSKSLPLFISSYGADIAKPESFFMGSKTIWRAVAEITRELKIHPHLLRHSYAMDLLQHSNDIRLVAQALGHSDVKITMRYTEERDLEVARAVEQSRRDMTGSLDDNSKKKRGKRKE